MNYNEEEFINGDIDNDCDEQEAYATNDHNNVSIGGDINPNLPPHNLLPKRNSRKAKIELRSWDGEKLIPKDLIIPGHAHGVSPTQIGQKRRYPKPDLPLNFIAAMALKNSQGGCLCLLEIYKFISHHFPYYEDILGAPWKNYLRSRMSFGDFFVKDGTNIHTISTWSANPVKANELQRRLKYYVENNGSLAIKKSMSNPAILELMVDGRLKENICTCAYSNYCQKHEHMLKNSAVTTDTQSNEKGNSISCPLEITKPALHKNVGLLTSKCEMLYDEDVKIVNEEWGPNEDYPETTLLTSTNCNNLQFKECQSLNSEQIIAEKITQEKFVPHTKMGLLMSRYRKPKLPLHFLTAMALKNSQSGCLPVSEIYKFISHHFPRFKDDPRARKNDLRDRLSICNLYVNIKSNIRGISTWSVNPVKADGLEKKLKVYIHKNNLAIKKSMSNPAILELMVEGRLKKSFSTCLSSEDQEEDEDLPIVSFGATVTQSNKKGNIISSQLEIPESTLTDNVVLPTASECEMIYDEDVKIEVKEEWRANADTPDADYSTLTNGSGSYIVPAAMEH